MGRELFVLRIFVCLLCLELGRLAAARRGAIFTILVILLCLELGLYLFIIFIY